HGLDHALRKSGPEEAQAQARRTRRPHPQRGAVHGRQPAHRRLHRLTRRGEGPLRGRDPRRIRPLPRGTPGGRGHCPGRKTPPRHRPPPGLHRHDPEAHGLRRRTTHRAHAAPRPQLESAPRRGARPDGRPCAAAEKARRGTGNFRPQCLRSMTEAKKMTQKQKSAFTPKLRFPEFQNDSAWTPVTLRDVSVPVEEKVGDRKLTPVSISADIGFVPQAEKFGRDISGNQYKQYTVVRAGDFVYYKGNSLRFPQGCIYQLRGWGEVAAPNEFICFRLKEGYPDGFFQSCFEKNIHGIQLQRHITSGARSNGLLNISRDTFFDIKIPTPSLAEQQ